MKKTTALQLWGSITLMIASSSGIAQSGKTAPSFNPKFLIQASADTPRSEDEDLASINRLKTINLKMYKDFTRYFEGARDIKMAFYEDHTVINCNMEDVKTRVLYNPKGRWMNTLRYLLPEQIPQNVIELVHTEFRKFQIRGATEVIVPAGSAILVRMENDRSFQTVRIVGNNYDVYEKFMKTK